MPKWEKPDQKTINLFNSIIPEDLHIEQRKMFGYPCCFYNNNMFMGLHNNNIVIRMSESDRKDFIDKHKAHIFEPIAGRQMKEYCIVPEIIIKDPKNLSVWIKKSLNYVKSLPAKQKKKK